MSEFCKRLSKLTGKDYRLPSEAEWEYACRGIQNSKFKIQNEESSPSLSYPPFHFGQTITGELANYNATYTYADEPQGENRGETIPVGQFPPNAFGLYDLHGQVWEWCEDTWHDNYQGAPTDGSAWTKGGNENRSPLRGGSFFVNPDDCRSAYRDKYINGRGFIIQNFGFRVVCGSGSTLHCGGWQVGICQECIRRVQPGPAMLVTA